MVGWINKYHHSLENQQSKTQEHIRNPEIINKDVVTHIATPKMIKLYKNNALTSAIYVISVANKVNNFDHINFHNYHRLYAEYYKDLFDHLDEKFAKKYLDNRVQIDKYIKGVNQLLNISDIISVQYEKLTLCVKKKYFLVFGNETFDLYVVT
jgi:hypothetical protein